MSVRNRAENKLFSQAFRAIILPNGNAFERASARKNNNSSFPVVSASSAHLSRGPRELLMSPERARSSSEPTVSTNAHPPSFREDFVADNPSGGANRWHKSSKKNPISLQRLSSGGLCQRMFNLHPKCYSSTGAGPRDHRCARSCACVCVERLARYATNPASDSCPTPTPVTII